MAVDDVIITFSYPEVLVQQLLYGDRLVLWEPGPGTVQEAPGSVPGEGFEVDGQDPPLPETSRISFWALIHPCVPGSTQPG